MRVSRNAVASFTQFWQFVDWIANTLIFFLTGLIIALELAQYDRNVISAADWGWAVVLWLFLLLIRTFVTLLFAPLLRRGDYGMSWRDLVVLSWAGLRGAVGLTLSLIIYYSPGECTRHVPAQNASHIL